MGYLMFSTLWKPLNIIGYNVYSRKKQWRTNKDYSEPPNKKRGNEELEKNITTPHNRGTAYAVKGAIMHVEVAVHVAAEEKCIVSV